MVGKSQIPVADVAVTAASHGAQTGEAMAMGERTPLALIDGPASARMAVTESILNIIAAPIRSLDTVKLSANWMAPAGYPGHDPIMYSMVEAIGMEFCPAIGVAIPVGKDSMSMQMAWQEDGEDKRVVSPPSVVITAFSAVENINLTLTPEVALDAGPLIHVRLSERADRLGGSILAFCFRSIGVAIPVGKDSMSMQMAWQEDGEDKRVVSPPSVVITAFSAVENINLTLTPEVALDAGPLIHVRLSERADRLGGSILAYCYESIGHEAPAVEDAGNVKSFVEIQQRALRDVQVVAYHDVSDGGLITCALEMSFAARASLDLNLGAHHNTASLFAEEPGAIVQAARGKEEALLQALHAAGLHAEVIGNVRAPEDNASPEVHVQIAGETVLRDDVLRLTQVWSETTYQMTRRRDNPETAQQEFDDLASLENTGLFARVNFALPAAPAQTEASARPLVAILREQGVNGELELTAALHHAADTQ